MQNLNEHINRMRQLIGAKHGVTKPLVSEQDNNPLAFATDPNNMDYAGFNKSSKPLPKEIELKVENRTKGTTETYKLKVGTDKSGQSQGETYILWNSGDQVTNISINDVFNLNFVLPFKARDIKLKANKNEIIYTDINRSSNEETPVILSCEKKGDGNYTFDFIDENRTVAYMKIVFDYNVLTKKTPSGIMGAMDEGRRY
jgi:hypothetical protein